MSSIFDASRTPVRAKGGARKITGARGVQDVYLKFFGNGTPLMNVDWWKFE